MSRPLRFTLIVLAGLVLLVLATSFFVSRTIEEWVDRDLSTRAQLALHGARPALVTSRITGSRERLEGAAHRPHARRAPRGGGGVHSRRRPCGGNQRVAGGATRGVVARARDRGLDDPDFAMGGARGTAYRRATTTSI